MPSREEILKALEAVIDPELRSSIVELGMVRSIDIHDDGRVAVMVSLTTPGCPIRSHFQTAVAKSVSALDGVTQVDVAFDVLTDQEKGALQHKLGRSNGLPEGALALVSNILCIGSGKGGVGKSTITANLAAALAEDGKKVGILDADVWGYSIPRMYGLGGTRPQVNEQRKIVPLEGRAASRSCRSASSCRRTPRSSGAGRCCTRRSPSSSRTSSGASWTSCSIDLPPGTGDVAMTLSQLLPQAQFLSSRRRSRPRRRSRAARRDGPQGQPRDRGVVENMSGFTTPSASASSSSARAAARSSPTSSTCRCSARSR
jgi:ATP-binding protein involved in chromosome partitioning